MLKTISLTCLSLFAFAGNSVLCRMALKDEAIDAASFTSVRLFSGAVLLVILVAIRTKSGINLKSGRWLSSFFLFLYATTLSYSYVSLATGTGALILFGAGQLTMILTALFRGKRLLPIEWTGLLIAFSGLFVLLLPGASVPSLTGFILMAIAGVAWGFYTLSGKGSTSPLEVTANNFLRTVPFIAVLVLCTFDTTKISSPGIALAITSGAVTSGLGYAIWYSALEGLTVTQAAVVQLTVPVIATFGGVLFSNELITMKLVVSSLLVLGGILVVTVGKQYIQVLTKSKK